VDLLLTEEWLPYIFKDDENFIEDDEEPLNEYFHDNGFESKLVIKTLGSTFVFLCVYIFLVLIYGLVYIVA
jgi:hypothetical protein